MVGPYPYPASGRRKTRLAIPLAIGRASIVGVTTVEQSPERALQLADEALATGDVDGAAAHLSTAIRGFTVADDRCQAAMACVRLGSLFANFIGNATAARAWYHRATRLVEDQPTCIEQGWVAVAALGCDVDDPAELLSRAELALDRARQFGDVNLETKALADGGLAYVQAGEVEKGMAMLDEAMALACGPADNFDAAAMSVCSFFTACYYAADFDRAGSWTDALRRQGLLGDRNAPRMILSGHCDSVQATALCELGRWDEAEAMLTRSIETFEQRVPIPSWHPAISLAELRIRQGRLAEAEMLLLGKDGHLQALLPAARLHLARGDYGVARATAVRGLRAIAQDRLRAAELLAVLVDIELGAGNLEAARKAYDELVPRAAGLDMPGLQARVAGVRARILVATGDLGGAIHATEEAIDKLPPTDVPVLRVTLLIDLVRLHERAGNHAAARVEAGHATAALAGLQVTVSGPDASLLARCLEQAAANGAGSLREIATLTRDEGAWVVESAGTRARLADTKGLRYLAELLRNPGAERHALDLVDRVEGTDGAAGVDRRQLGDAGEILDSVARAAYRRRIEAARAEIDDALALGADERAEALQGELDQLVAQLAQAFGLGGRSRRASAVTERARLNVTRALRAATAKVSEVLPDAGAVLDRRLRTGLYCAFEPGDDDPVRWIVHT